MTEPTRAPNSGGQDSPQDGGTAAGKFNPDMLRLAQGSQERTQTALAAAISVSQGKVSKWEDGLLTPVRGTRSDSEMSQVSDRVLLPA